MFLPGAYPHVNGVLTNCQSRSATQDVELRQDLTCWSDILKQEGYQTAYIGKNIFYEEAVCIPLFLAYGDHIAPRMDNDLLISIEDFCPTVLSLMGLKDRIPATVQARDLSEQVKGSREQMPDGQLYMRYNAVNETGTNVDNGLRGFRTLTYTYAVRFKQGKVVERFLFDRKKDPSQLENIVDRHPEVADGLHARMKKRLVETNDPAAAFL